MEHIKCINIGTFRGIRSLQLDDLLPINILTGDNNCGKTSVLEVLESFEDPGDFRCWRRLLRRENSPAAMGRLSYYEGFCDLFDVGNHEKRLEYTIQTTKDHKCHVVLSAQEETVELTEEEYAELSGLSYTKTEDDYEQILLSVSKLQMEVEENGEITGKDWVYEGQRLFRTSPQHQDGEIKKKDGETILYISPVRHAEGNIFLSSILSDPELYEDMLEILKEYDKDIISINYDRDEKSVSGRGIYKILSRSHKKALPLNVYGDGMKKAILLMSAVVRAKGGILLLDEFETAIHTSAMDGTFRWILESCMKLNVQVFLTSHSKEAIEEVLRCAPDLQDKMAVYTLYKEENRTLARRLSGKKAVMVQDDMGLELRS